MTGETYGDGVHHNQVGGQARIGNVVQSGHIEHFHLHGAEVPPPRQLRPEIRNFVDRDTEQARVFRAAGEWQGEDRPLVVSLSGLSGVGKTTLAFRLARRLVDEWGADSGVLYVDLEPLRRDGGVEVAAALGELLSALGVREEWLGRTYEARSAQYWDRTRDKRFVVLVDNVRFGSEAEALLPASEGSVAVVVSHGPLYDLGGDDAVEIPLSPLPDEDAVRLLTGIVGDTGLVDEPAATGELVRLCGGLPAALQVAGRWVRRHRRHRPERLLAGFAEELRERGIPVVEAVWDAAYEDLAEPARRLYRLFPAGPAPDLPLAAITALLGEGPDAAEDALQELENAGLVEGEEGEGENAGEGRLRMHDLVRVHAARRAEGEGSGEGFGSHGGGGSGGFGPGDGETADAGPHGTGTGTGIGAGAGAGDGDPVNPGPDPGLRETADARRRITRWYLRQAQRADRLAAGPRMTFGAEAHPVLGAPDVEFGGKAHALRWLAAERHALCACVRIAYEDGADADAWALCEPLWTHHLDHPHHPDVVEAFRTGLAAARRAEHLAAAVRMRCQLARPLWERGDYAEAARELDAAVSGARLLPDSERKLRASALEFRGKLRAVQEEWEAAVPDFEASLRIHQELPNPYGVLLLTHLLGQCAAGLGQLDSARELLTRAHQDAREQRRERMTARTGFELGRVLQRLERVDEARALYEAALASARERESTFDEARVHDALGDLAERTGDTTAARTHREAAAEIRRREGAV
ncbi:tetratricopeptide repeat protein [Streptomyces sp. NPDC050704]|uniref:tetratricopeptide repeat protein n=1 Tax=Streptomyces sp. NPDC050704 TaxID=3157219 RepID=UPI00344A0DC4